jgi:serine protease
MRRLRNGLWFVVAIGLGWLDVATAVAGSSHTNRIIVTLQGPSAAASESALDARDLERLEARAGIALRVLRVMAGNAQVLELPVWLPEAAAAAIAEQLAGDPAVAGAEPDRLKQPWFVPNDSDYFRQWALFESAGGLRLPAAWDAERGQPTVVVGLVDSGSLTHSDLDSARTVPGYDFISALAISNDGDGRDADPTDPGDAVAADECGAGEPAEDSSWHGTQVTGVIGAATDNSQGIAGVNHGSRLLMARALGKCGGFTSDIVDAMRWAAGLAVPGVPANPNPARVINLSFGGPGPCSAIEQTAVNAVTAAGAVVVAAAGNEGGDVADSSPANCANVIAVAATTRSGGRASFTNVGAAIEVSAPGGEFGDGVLTLFNDGLTSPIASPAGDAFAFVAGTSIAAAHVSGVAALLFSANDQLSPAQVADILQTTARPFPDSSCTTATCGAGIVDADAAVQSALAAQGLASSSSSGVDGGGGGCTLTQRSEPGLGLPLMMLFAIGNMFLRRVCGGKRAHLAKAGSK